MGIYTETRKVRHVGRRFCWHVILQPSLWAVNAGLLMPPVGYISIGCFCDDFPVEYKFVLSSMLSFWRTWKIDLALWFAEIESSLDDLWWFHRGNEENLEPCHKLWLFDFGMRSKSYNWPSAALYIRRAGCPSLESFALRRLGTGLAHFMTAKFRWFSTKDDQHYEHLWNWLVYYWQPPKKFKWFH